MGKNTHKIYMLSKYILDVPSAMMNSVCVQE
jgi:hypothetical protein